MESRNQVETLYIPKEIKGYTTIGVIPPKKCSDPNIFYPHTYFFC